MKASNNIQLSGLLIDLGVNLSVIGYMGYNYYKGTIKGKELAKKVILGSFLQLAATLGIRTVYNYFFDSKSEERCFEELIKLRNNQENKALYTCGKAILNAASEAGLRCVSYKMGIVASESKSEIPGQQSIIKLLGKIGPIGDKFLSAINKATILGAVPNALDSVSLIIVGKLSDAVNFSEADTFISKLQKLSDGVKKEFIKYIPTTAVSDVKTKFIFALASGSVSEYLTGSNTSQSVSVIAISAGIAYGMLKLYSSNSFFGNVIFTASINLGLIISNEIIEHYKFQFNQLDFIYQNLISNLLNGGNKASGTESTNVENNIPIDESNNELKANDDSDNIHSNSEF